MKKIIAIIGFIFLALISSVSAMTYDGMTINSTDNTASIYFDEPISISDVTINVGTIDIGGVSYTKNGVFTYISNYTIDAIVNTSIFPVATIDNINTVTITNNLADNTSGYIQFTSPSFYISNVNLYYGTSLNRTTSFDPYPEEDTDVTVDMRYLTDQSNTVTIGYTTYSYEEPKSQTGALFVVLASLFGVYIIASSAFVLISILNGSSAGIIEVIFIDIGLFIIILISFVIRSSLLKLL
jgi:hypothetical protein